MTRRARHRGFLLVLALLLTVLISLISLSLLGMKSGGYTSSRAAVNLLQARSLAHSGMADIFIKLSKDPLFPDGMGDTQERFSYREEVTDSSKKVAGSYTVVIDRKYRHTHQVIRVECTGVSGELTNESATHRIYGELSTKAGDFRFKVWEEGKTPRL